MRGTRTDNAGAVLASEVRINLLAGMPVQGTPAIHQVQGIGLQPHVSMPRTQQPVLVNLTRRRLAHKYVGCFADHRHVVIHDAQWQHATLHFHQVQRTGHVDKLHLAYVNYAAHHCARRAAATCQCNHCHRSAASNAASSPTCASARK
jgi:hypothetical protein